MTDTIDTDPDEILKLPAAKRLSKDLATAAHDQRCRGASG
jgi:hypothetical protein